MSKPIKILALLALLVLLAVAAAALVVRSHLSVDALVADLEKSYNLRAQVGGYQARIFARPSRLTVENLVIAPRDAVVKAGTPHSQREPIADDVSILRAEKVELEVDLEDLLGWELDMKKLVFHGLKGNIVIGEEGEDSIAPLLEKPDKEDTPEETEKEEDKAATGPKKIRLPIPATMDRAAIASGSLTIENRRQGSRTTLDNFELELTNISLDADALDTKNHCDLRLATRLTMANLKTGEPFLDFTIRGEGKAEPLDSRDGSFSPSLDADFTIAQGSSVSGLPFLSMLSGSIEALSKIGLKLGDLESRSALAEDVTTSIRYEDGRLLFRDPLDLDFDRYAMGLGEGSWLNLETMQHDFKGGLSVSEDLTTEAREGVEKFIRDKVGNTAADLATESVLSPLINAAGRLTLSFVSSGSLTEPDVGVVTPIGGIGNIMEDISGKLIRQKGGIEGLLKGLLD